MKAPIRMISSLIAAALITAPVTQLPDIQPAYTAYAYESDTSDPLIEKVSGHYGYDFLGTTDKGTKKQLYYKRVFELCADFYESDSDIESEEEDVSFGSAQFSDLGLTQSEARAVKNFVMYDNPLFYFVANHFYQTGSSTYIHVSKEYYSSEARAKCKESIESFIDEMTDGLDALGSDYEKARIVESRLSARAEYAFDDMDSVPSHNIMGIIDLGKGVCESYAKCFQLILNYIGLDNAYIIGDETNNNGGHAWNAVKFDDGKYYYADPTWDDSGSFDYYFAKGRTLFNKEHKSYTTANAINRYLYDIDIPDTDFDFTPYVGEFADIINAYDFNIEPDDTVTITRYKLDETSVTVPETILGMPITAIGANAFAGKNGIESIKLPDTVTEIGDLAFIACFRLKDIELPAGLETIGKDVFMFDSEIYIDTIPDSVTSIGSGAFYYDYNGPAKVKIPSAVTSIGDYAFGFVSEGSISYNGDGNYEKLSPVKFSDDFTIVCVKDSAAYDYALKFGFLYELYEDEEPKDEFGPGDADHDGEVDINDVLLIQQFIAKWDVEIDEHLSDVNADSEVDINDVLLIQQYIAKWDVELKNAE